MKKDLFYFNVSAMQQVLRPPFLLFGILDEVMWKG